MQFTIKHSKSIAIIISAVMLIMTTMAAVTPSYAAMQNVPSPTQIDELVSSDYHKCEHYKIRTPLNEKNVIYVEGKTKEPATLFCIRLSPHNSTNAKITVFVIPDENGEFSIKINTTKGNKEEPEVLDSKGIMIHSDETYGSVPGYKAVGDIPPGYYHLLISKAINDKDADVSPGTQWWTGHLGGGKGYAYKEAVLLVKSGQNNNPKVVKYQTVIDNNNNVRNMYEQNSLTDSSYKGSYVRYQDVYLKDMEHLLLNNPKTGKIENLTAANVNFLKNTSKNVTAGAKTDYEKGGKIYEYVATNFYYDTYANKTGKNQYDNPYKNLYNFKNNVNSANSVKGKVATTCQGFAGMVIALARAEGIPARIVNGQHISQCVMIWEDKKTNEIGKTTHWWAELWIDNRWVVVDANAAAGSTWNRSSFEDKGTWNKACHISYSAYDPSAIQMSDSYIYNDIYHGSTEGKYINRANEVAQLRAFLDTKSSGKTNGKRLNSNYSSTDFATWGTTADDDFLTDGYGRVTHMLWGKKGLTGTLNLSNFSQLKYLTVYSNSIKSLNLKGCTSLQKISATYNKFTTFDSSASKNTTSIATKGNKLTSAKFKHGAKTISISRNTGGTFAFDYNKSKSKSLTIYAGDPAKGYKYLGIYNGNGKKLSSSKTYTFKPTATKYVVKYKKK